MPSASIHGAQLHYEESGVGDPLLMIHGSWGDLHGWDLVVPGLAKHFRVIRYSRRGHSESRAPAGQGSVQEDAADALGLMAALGLGPAFLAGNSYGSCIALRAAANDPAAIRSILVHEPPLIGALTGDPAFAPMVEGFQSRAREVRSLLARNENEEGAKRFVETIALGPGGWQQLTSAQRNTFTRNAQTWADEMRDPTALVMAPNLGERYRGPVLLSQGDQSPPFFGAINAKVTTALPQTTRYTFPGAGHMPHATHPAAYVERATEWFLKGR